MIGSMWNRLDTSGATGDGSEVEATSTAGSCAQRTRMNSWLQSTVIATGYHSETHSELWCWTLGIHHMNDPYKSSESSFCQRSFGVSGSTSSRDQAMVNWPLRSSSRCLRIQTCRQGRSRSSCCPVARGSAKVRLINVGLSWLWLATIVVILLEIMVINLIVYNMITIVGYHWFCIRFHLLYFVFDLIFCANYSW